MRRVWRLRWAAAMLGGVVGLAAAGCNGGPGSDDMVDLFCDDPDCPKCSTYRMQMESEERNRRYLEDHRKLDEWLERRVKQARDAAQASKPGSKP